MYEKKIQESNEPPPTYNESAASPVRPIIQNIPFTNLDRGSLEQKFQDITRKYEISTRFAQKLQILESFKVVFVFDDSGSMNTVLQDSPLNNSNSLFKATRWDELQYFANISIEIASIFNPNGCDIYFLNRYPSPVRNITDASQLVNYFRDKPQGFTPLASAVQQVLNDNPPQTLSERKLLIIIATDGEPTDSQGKVNIPQFKETLLKRSNNVFTTIVACTDDDDSVGYLNKWDKTMRNIDIVDDYKSEKNEVKRAQGQNFSFTFGDYVVKSLIGSIDSELDNLDESKPEDCCLIL
jgi:hypothetical protein